MSAFPGDEAGLGGRVSTKKRVKAHGPFVGCERLTVLTLTLLRAWVGDAVGGLGNDEVEEAVSECLAVAVRDGLTIFGLW